MLVTILTPHCDLSTCIYSGSKSSDSALLSILSVHIEYLCTRRLQTNLYDVCKAETT